MAHIGVPKRERETPQPLIVDVVLSADLDSAARADDVRRTVDYKIVVDKVRKMVEESHCKLLEALALRLCQGILEDRRIGSVTVSVQKSPETLKGKLGHVVIEMTR